MKKLLTLSVLAFVAAAAFALVAVSPSTAVAHEGEDHEAEAIAQADTEEQAEVQPTNPYSFTAQSGDSYTKIARKAVQIYGITNNVSLSGAQIVAAETFLTRDAGSPALNYGQAVELNNDTIKAAVEKAQALDEAAKARWEKYVAKVDFNTDNVGEARS